MSPFSGHTPIHARWSEHHRPVATGTHTATCTITRDTGIATGTLDGDNVYHPPAGATTVYTGGCRVIVHSVTGAHHLVVGEQQVATTDYEIAIDWDAPEVLEHDIVTITDAEDPGLVGKQLQVNDIRYASETFERVLICTDDLTRREGA